MSLSINTQSKSLSIICGLSLLNVSNMPSQSANGIFLQARDGGIKHLQVAQLNVFCTGLYLFSRQESGTVSGPNVQFPNSVIKSFSTRKSPSL